MKADKAVAKSKFSSLPSGTNVENLLKLINVLKKNNKSEETVKALFGMGDTAYSSAKAALKAFGIIETNCLEFTSEMGREIAFTGEDNKKDVIIRIVKCFEPYELVLDSIITSRVEIKVTDIDTIKNLWGRADFGSGDRNRNDSATLFMSILDYIGFSRYLLGRGANPTRIEWASDIKDKINKLSEEKPSDEQQENKYPQGKDTIEESVIDSLPMKNEQEEDTPDVVFTNERDDKQINKPISVVGLPNITINVDMGDWSDEKIKTFFKYAYGKFGED